MVSERHAAGLAPGASRQTAERRDAPARRHAWIAAALALLVVGGTPARAQAPQAGGFQLTLPDAVKLSSDSATLRARAATVRSVRANEITAGLLPNPTLGYSVGTFFAGAAADHAISLGQTIELGGKLRRRVESAKAATRVDQFNFDDVRRLVVLQVKTAFAGVLVAQATLQLAVENMRNLDEVERLQRLRAERGDLSELELFRIQGQRFQFDSDAAEARRQVYASKVALRTAIGPDRIPERFETAGRLEFREVPFELPDLHELTRVNRPDVRAAEADRERARADVNLARANAVPDIQPSVTYNRIHATPVDQNAFGLGLTVTLPAFNRNQGEIARTIADAERADAQREAVVTQALADVDTAYAALATSRQKFLLLRDTYLPKATQVRERVQASYLRGAASLLDYLDAERSYRETARAYLGSLGDYTGAFYQLEAAAGGFLE